MARAPHDPPAPRAPAGTGDLFEHFGIPEGPAPAEGAVPRPVPGYACAGCGWLREAHEDAPCPQCGCARAP